MIVPQIVVIVLLVSWSHVWSAAAVGALTLAQAIALPRLVADPKGKARLVFGARRRAFMSPG